MGRKRLGSELFIFMNGEKVGLLSRASNGKLAFQYDATWLDSKSGRPLSLSMPLTDQTYSGDEVENYFDNLLPDSQPIRNRIQQRFGARSNRGFDLLWHVGSDCVGAIQLLPEDTQVDVQKIESESLSDAEIAETLKSYRTMPLGMREDKEFRISIAGAQEKTALLRLDDEWHRPLGMTPTSHIFKLPIGRIEHSGMDLSDSVENEWLCHAILKAYEIPVANTEMMTFEDTKALVVERFDRRWSTDKSWLIRLPQEDMCQALGVPPALKYESDGGPGIEQIMKLLLGSAHSLADRRTFMTRVFLFWVLGAIDGHAKNFSLALKPGGEFQLTPAYDVLSAYPLIAKKQLEQRRMTMAMSLRGKNRQYQWERMFGRHWLSTAKRCNFPSDEMTQIIERIMGEMDPVIERVSARLPKGFPDDVATPIFDGMKRARERMG
ncbi:type II toxin-antitoxin system HipA family toxin [Geothermobacter hydrogeniphilus]|uniref:Serine/threonine protein kinase n=1 Tax=Geothermobacter hydrogeniphilus TaxID=1969733 RepID=A0A1X0YBL4_9BACT|nr:type II toxin-antitoxin system HipA family toxin [Geothermobacter hydrogeniphilus]ORJ62483.1 serine/threonine protein kinase [Geothermobacter hydrogeniphilus]